MTWNLLSLLGIALGCTFIIGMVRMAGKRNQMPTGKEYIDYENEINAQEALHVKPLRRGNP